MIGRDGGKAVFQLSDVTKEDNVRKMVEKTVDLYGSLDVLFNNAGVELIKPLHETSEAEYNRVININLRGVFLGCKYGIRQMLKQGRGIIVNTASAGGIIASTDAPVYSASKGGVIMLTKTLAVDYGNYNIRANCLCPGFVRTAMNDRFLEHYEVVDPIQNRFCDCVPIKRPGTPEEAARVALFLACEDSSYVNGTALVMDGGIAAG